MDTAPLLALLDWLDDVLQSGPPPSAAPSADWSSQLQEAINELTAGDTAQVSVVFDLLGALGWTSLWETLRALSRPIGLDSPRSELDYIHQAAVQQPNLDERIRAACAAALMRKYAQSEAAQLSWLETLARYLPGLSGRDQLRVLEYLGITGTAAEGLIAMLAWEAIEAGILAPLPANVMAMRSSMPFGDWDRPGRMPEHLYMGERIHLAIGLKYSTYHVGHEVFLTSVPIGMILDRLAERLSFDRGPLERALGRKRPDIFDFSYDHIGAPGWVYEIKPATLARDAVLEGQWYAEIFLRLLLETMPGPPTAPGTVDVVPAPNGWAMYWPAGPGALIYQYVRASPAEIRARNEERRRQAESAALAQAAAAHERLKEQLAELAQEAGAALAIAAAVVILWAAMQVVGVGIAWALS